MQCCKRLHQAVSTTVFVEHACSIITISSDYHACSKLFNYPHRPCIKQYQQQIASCMQQNIIMHAHACSIITIFSDYHACNDCIKQCQQQFLFVFVFIFFFWLFRFFFLFFFESIFFNLFMVQPLLSSTARAAKTRIQKRLHISRLFFTLKPLGLL